MRSSVVCASWLPSINNMYILCYVIVHLSIIYKIRHAPLLGAYTKHVNFYC